MATEDYKADPKFIETYIEMQKLLRAKGMSLGQLGKIVYLYDEETEVRVPLKQLRSSVEEENK